MEQLRAAFDSVSQWWFDLHFSLNQKKALAVIAVVILLGSVVLVVQGNSTNPQASAEIIPITIAEPEIFVDVTGAVNNPGVYTLTGKIQSYRCH